jgi:hypothetical protein
MRKQKNGTILRALYGLKSSGACWRNDMAETLQKAQFVSCVADPDVWMRPVVKINGDKYYEYVLMYVDDVLALSETPQLIMDYLSKCYMLKEGSVKEPDQYLGAQIKKHVLPGDDPSKFKWAISSDLYVKKAV